MAKLNFSSEACMLRPMATGARARQAGAAAPPTARAVEALMPRLAPAERKVAAYVVQHPEDAIRLSVTEVADRSGASEATVVRLCKKAGFQGFQDLKIRLLRELVPPIRAIHEEVGIDDGVSTVVQKVFSSSVAALQETGRALDQVALERAAALLDGADQVALFGVGNSGLVALDAADRLLRLGLRVLAETEGHHQAVRATLLGPADVVIAISHSGATRDVIAAVEIARRQGARVIVVSHQLRSPLASLSDVVLTSAAQETAFRTEAMAARLAMLTMLDTLFVLVSLRRYDATLENIAQIRDATATKRL
jgi:RpiR family transcriptional regulator, carbohydrate utilization regulator